MQRRHSKIAIGEMRTPKTSRRNKRSLTRSNGARSDLPPIAFNAPARRAPSAAGHLSLTKGIGESGRGQMSRLELAGKLSLILAALGGLAMVLGLLLVDMHSR